MSADSEESKPPRMRSREEVDATLQVAKLNPAELLPTVQCLSFGPQIDAGDYCLLQLEPELCHELEAGRSLVIRGEKNEYAVICSKDKTYDMKIADTSNMLLFIPSGETPEQLHADKTTTNILHPESPGAIKLFQRGETATNDPLGNDVNPLERCPICHCAIDKPYTSAIAGFSNHFWELRRCRPKLKKLKRLLLENPYEGPDSEKERMDANSKYTTEDFLDLVQASEEETMHQLKVLKACQVQDVSLPKLGNIIRASNDDVTSLGYWRILDFDYEMKLLNHVTQLIYSESWLFNKIPLSICIQELGPLEPKEMIEHILESYGKKYMEEDEAYFELNEEKVCRAIAQMLLENAVKFNLSEFQEVWQQSVPEGMTTRLDQLKGLALVDRSSKPEIIFLLNVEDLPEDDNERFKRLFSIREKWTEADIAPYIEDLCSEKQKIGTLLTKYARSSMQNGLKVYNSRRPVS